MKTVLLTGANGFLGSHLLEALLNEGYSVVILKRSTSDTWRIKSLLTNIKSYDLDRTSITHIFEQQKIDVIIHTACNYGRSGESMHDIASTNLMFGLTLLDIAIANNVSTFVNTDTFLQKNLSKYALSKHQFTQWLELQSKEINVINLKLEHIYGPKDDTTKFAPWIISQLKGKVATIPLTKGEQMRDFIYIDDVVSAYLCLLSKSENSQGFNEYEVGTGNLTSVRHFVELIKESYENQNGPCATQLVFGSIPYRPGERMTIEVDNSALIKAGWSAKSSLEDGITKIFGYNS